MIWLLPLGFAVLSWWLDRAARRVPRSRFGPVLLRDRARCLMCELERVDDVRRANPSSAVDVRWIWDQLDADHGSDT